MFAPKIMNAWNEFRAVAVGWQGEVAFRFHESDNEDDNESNNDGNGIDNDDK